MNTIAAALTAFFKASGTASLLTFVGALALIGTASMAVLQVLKDATPLRQRYQRSRVRRWLAEGATEAAERHATLLTNSPLNVDDAERELVRLAVDGDQNALYDLSIEQLSGQINAALQMVIDYPSLNRPLLLIAASAANTDDVAAILNSDRSQFDPRDADPAKVALRVTYADARNRVSHQFQRAVDAFQIATSFRWKWSLQMASFVLSAAFAVLALVAGNGSFTFFTVVGTALMAGFFAPIARDLTASIQKLRAG